MTELAARSVTVCGLTLHVEIGSEDPIIGGPAIYSALGVLNAGISPQLISSFGNNLTLDDRRVIDSIDPQAYSRYPIKTKPMIGWRSPPVLGESGKGQLSDDPSLWTTVPEDDRLLFDAVLVLANGDPVAYAKLLETAKPALIVMDVHAEWLAYRSREISECFRRADLATITEHEYHLLPKSALSGIKFGHGQKIMVIKRGIKGVSILASGEVYNLPPPLPRWISTDIGCGDFLLGLIAGYFVRNMNINPHLSLSECAIGAYMNALQPLTHLIESKAPRCFLFEQLDEMQRKRQHGD